MKERSELNRSKSASKERGANLAEYLVLLICIVVLCIVAISSIGPLNPPAFEKATRGLQNDAPDSGGGTSTGAELDSGGSPQDGAEDGAVPQ